LFVVFSPQGGSGCTTLAINLAVALHQLTREPTVLVDGNMQSADIGVHLNLSPRAKTIADLADSLMPIDPDALERVLIRHSSGVRVLMGPATPDKAEAVVPQSWLEVLDVLCQTHANVIVDTSPTYSELTLNTLDAADVILVPMPLELTNLKNTRLFLQVAEKLGYPRDKVQLIASRFDRADGIVPEVAETSLERQFLDVISSDRRSLVLALNRGVPVVMRDGKSPIARDFSRLAQKVASLRLPLPESPPNPAKRVSPESKAEIVSPSDSPKIRVFIVDDIEDTCENLARLIGFESDMKVVGIAHDGAEALRIAPAARPDVVLMDIMMPMMDGITATEILTRMPGWKAPVVMMSVQDGAEYQNRALAAGARGYLEKPFSADDFIGFIRQVHKLEMEVRVLN